MPRDRFKEFVHAHREEFENQQQDFEQIWQGIESRLPAKSGFVLNRWVGLAASVLLLALLSWTFINQTRYEMPTEMQETEQHYVHLINLKMEELSEHQNRVDQLIWEDLEMLDREYQQLKRDLKEQADQEEVARAMVENQRSKLQILDQILQEIESKSEYHDVKTLDI